ncbi:MAG: glycine--tRNA ligase subunit beta [Firmicutes bacterium]|nr:glycine--tRNA ligase subunit beta [Bacillota bacterium]
MARDFLLEIGVEELPARFLQPALEQLTELARTGLQANRLAHGEISVCGTPRRITLYVRDLAEQQDALALEVKGPAVKVAFNSAGEPTRAAIGFAKSNGLQVAELARKSVGPVEYVFAVKEEAGRAAGEVLPGLAAELITGLHFAKPMRWGSLEMRFARPIRWLLCLYGHETVDFTLAGLSSGRSTYGHRFLSAGRLEVPAAGAYFEVMSNAHVLVDIQQRREEIRRQVIAAAEQEGGRADIDPELLDEVTNLVEFPAAVCGSFDPGYLEMLEEVLITPMREHQRYFPVRGQDGRLLARFIAISNGGAANVDIVRAGNEKVLRARLSDAAFFWREDLKAPLEEKVAGLQKVVFQEQLGTVYEKVQRITALADFLAAGLNASPAERADVLRAAQLSKADLLTNMVYEFPELQGIMGCEYARRSGETSGVAQAVYEHYLPRFAGDELPGALAGQMLSIADKMDSLTGCFGVGLQPTGSQDPYALRRQALGVCHIIIEGGLVLSLGELIEKAYNGYTGGYAGQVSMKLPLDKVAAEMEEFFKQRLRGMLSEKGLPYDTVDAVLAAGIDDISGVWLRAEALRQFRSAEAFEELLTAFTRAYNLAKKADHELVDPARLETEAEKELYEAVRQARLTVEPALAGRNYARALEAIAGLRQPVDRFFAEVMVMVEDTGLRDNRLALLKQIAGLAGRIADLSKIVQPGK